MESIFPSFEGWVINEMNLFMIEKLFQALGMLLEIEGDEEIGEMDGDEDKKVSLTITRTGHCTRMMDELKIYNYHL